MEDEFLQPQFSFRLKVDCKENIQKVETLIVSIGASSLLENNTGSSSYGLTLMLQSVENGHVIWIQLSH